MIQSKFSLADLLTVLGTLIFGFFCFFSFNFLTQGDTTTSLVWASVIALVIGGLAFGAKLLKRTSRNFKTYIIWEWILLFFFVLIGIIAIFPFSHYFAVSEQKEEIQQQLISNITQAESMFVKYEEYANNRIDKYKNNLNSIVNAKIVNSSEYLNCKFVEGTDDNIQIENKVFTLIVHLYPSNYQEMEQVDSIWLADSKKAVGDWSPSGVVKVMNTVKAETTSWKEQLSNYSQFLADCENSPIPPFEFPLNFSNVNDKIINLQRPIPLSIGIAFGLYLFMLLSYFITKRHTRFPGFKAIFGNNIHRDNQL
jgi:hypothetical protein